MNWASGYCDMGVRPADNVYNLGLLSTGPVSEFDGFGVTQQGSQYCQDSFHPAPAFGAHNNRKTTLPNAGK
jgi:hypothetical protein